MMEEPYSVPGLTSRGAIQQRTPDFSSIAQQVSAAILSRLEWLINASKGIAFLAVRNKRLVPVAYLYQDEVLTRMVALTFALLVLGTACVILSFIRS